MPTPTNRTPVRVARGTYSNLNTNKADIQEGEICYATDQDKLYVKEGSNLVDATPATDITGKANIASPTFTGTVAIPNIANLETAVTANTAKVTNATHTGDVTGSTTLTIAAGAVETGMIADDAVTTDKLANAINNDIAAKAPLASPTFTGTPAAPTASQGTNTTQVATTAFVNSEIAADLTAAIGSTVQAYDANTVKKDESNVFASGQEQKFSGVLYSYGRYQSYDQFMSSSTINLSIGNYFSKNVNGITTFTFSNPPSSGIVYSFTLEVTHSSGTITWPSSVKWPADTAPTLTTGKTHLFIFVTDNGGSRYRGAALADYVN